MKYYFLGFLIHLTKYKQQYITAMFAISTFCIYFVGAPLVGVIQWNLDGTGPVSGFANLDFDEWAFACCLLLTAYIVTNILFIYIVEPLCKTIDKISAEVSDMKSEGEKYYSKMLDTRNKRKADAGSLSLIEKDT